jgi:nucleotide-binding universal stress UspA family protein
MPFTGVTLRHGGPTVADHWQRRPPRFPRFASSGSREDRTAGDGRLPLAALALRETTDAAVSLLHVADEGDEEASREFLPGWAEEHDLGDADLRVERSDVEAAIARHDEAARLVVIGATGRGLLARVVRGPLPLDVIEDLDPRADGRAAQRPVAVGTDMRPALVSFRSFGSLATVR